MGSTSPLPEPELKFVQLDDDLAAGNDRRISIGFFPVGQQISAEFIVDGETPNLFVYNSNETTDVSVTETSGRRQQEDEEVLRRFFALFFLLCFLPSVADIIPTDMFSSPIRDVVTLVILVLILPLLGPALRIIVSWLAARRQPEVSLSGGGVYITDSHIGRDVIGNSRYSLRHASPRLELEADSPLAAAIASARSPEADATLAALAAEVSKGDSANDYVTAKLAKELVGLVPEASSAMVNAFSTPLFSNAGPVTKFVIDELRDK
jgi:hypothetical protein